LTTDALPQVSTETLPVPEARDEAWHLLEEHPLIEVEDGYATGAANCPESAISVTD